MFTQSHRGTKHMCITIVVKNTIFCCRDIQQRMTLQKTLSNVKYAQITNPIYYLNVLLLLLLQLRL